MNGLSLPNKGTTGKLTCSHHPLVSVEMIHVAQNNGPFSLKAELLCSRFFRRVQVRAAVDLAPPGLFLDKSLHISHPVEFGISTYRKRGLETW